MMQKKQDKPAYVFSGKWDHGWFTGEPVVKVAVYKDGEYIGTDTVAGAETIKEGVDIIRKKYEK